MGSRSSKSKKNCASSNQKNTSIKSSRIEGSFTQSDLSIPSPPAVEEKNLGPEWLHETQFEELLTANVAQFSKIVGFRVKPAMAPGENYATLMLRISIDVELTGESSSTKTYFRIPNKMHNLVALESAINMRFYWYSKV